MLRPWTILTHLFIIIFLVLYPAYNSLTHKKLFVLLLLLLFIKPLSDGHRFYGILYNTYLKIYNCVKSLNTNSICNVLHYVKQKQSGISFWRTCYRADVSSSLAECQLRRMAVSWLRRLITGLSPWRSGYTPGSVHVGFVVDRVSLGQVFSEFFCFSVSVSLHRAPILVYHPEMNNRPVIVSPRRR
jgi:hypothetical protein